jgi:hypothetical protein
VSIGAPLMAELAATRQTSERKDEMIREQAKTIGGSPQSWSVRRQPSWHWLRIATRWEPHHVHMRPQERPTCGRPQKRGAPVPLLARLRALLPWLLAVLAVLAIVAVVALLGWPR